MNSLHTIMQIAFAIWSMVSCNQHSTPSTSSPLTFDFGKNMPEPWSCLNDNVMGGVSQGTLERLDSTAQWSGATRLENNGGFASLRSPWGQHNLSDLDRIVVKCRGTGGPFKLTMETSQRWWMPYAYASFEPSTEWQEVIIEVSDLKWSQAQMGDLTSVRPSRDLGEVLRLGLMKYDGTAQPFNLEIQSISLHSTPQR